ncbi:deacetylase [Clostridium gelidum]|uniref:Deacetylase n=1 Tax=Clostridium gelidum TaxID=704125 RepID=A0ABN6IXM6_9CLOT|nr:polysaccharide deacetylase family protein [Clostridium gelidum]BCZ46864.1 deacetylase [Clostridium gelidum]
MKRTKCNIKNKKNKRTIFIILTKLILFIAVVSIAFIISINQRVKISSNVTFNQENDQKETSEKASEKVSEKGVDQFEGISVINDNRGVPVLCYHSINSDPLKKNSITMSKEKFREQLKIIKDSGYITLTMAELNDYLFKDKSMPEKSVVISFDDGYRDNYNNAFPILKEFNMNATIFVISSYLNRDSYLTAEEIKEMSDYGIDIESHTVSHVKLSTLSYKDQLKELKNSKDTIENITGKPVISIAYPEGKFNKDTKKATLEAGYSMGFTIERGYADRNDNPAQLNRICVDYTYKPNNIINVLKNLKK